MPLRRSTLTLVAVGTIAAAGACRTGGAVASTSPRSPTSPTAAVPPPAPLAASPTGAELPESLPDTTFWRMVRTFSEPGGYFRSENFVSNEMGLQQVVTRLRETMPPGGVYLGVGPEQNFTYLAALRPRVAFIVDIRRQNLLQHLWYKAVFELSPTRAEFLSRLFARPMKSVARGLSSDSLVVLLDAATPDTTLFRRTFAEVRQLLVDRHGFAIDSTDLATLRYVDSVFFVSGPSLNYSSGASGTGYYNRRMPTFAQIATTVDERGTNIGFLGNEDAYAVVRDLQRRNLVVPLTGDFAGPHALRTVGEWLRERHATVGAFYVSNVEQYLFQQGNDWNRFYATVGELPIDANSRFIRSTSGGFRGNGGGMMMTQLLSPIRALVDGVTQGTIRGYYDVINFSQP